MRNKLWMVALMGLFGACNGGDSGGGNVAPSAPNTVAGLVTDIGSGARLSGVTVRVVGSSRTTTTDARGEFELRGLSAGLVKLDFEKAGYAPGHGIAESASSAQTVLVALKKDGAEQSYDPTQARTLFQRTEAGPYAVIFQPNSLDTTDTNLRVVVTPLDPTKEDSALPGDLVAGGASSTPLAPVTFAEFSILDSQNRRINLKPGSSAIVELPIPPELRSQYKIGDKIHCYAYNPQTGRWEDFVEGTVERSSVDGTTPVLRASIRHFSWYGGAPAVQEQECVDIEVRGRDGPLDGAVVTARPGLRAVTNRLGQASITVQKGGPVNFVATKTYTDTFVDSRGNLIPKPGAKVIDIGKVYEDDLIGLDGRNYSRRPGPCPPESSQSVRAAATNPLPIRVAPAPEGFFQALALLQPGGIAFVQLEKGIPNADGDLENAEPASGAQITISDNTGRTATLTELAPGTYIANSFDIVPGRRYTLSIDADGNGSIDGSGSAFAVGNVSWSNLVNGGSYSAASLTATWNDSAATQPGYSALYQVTFQRQGGSGLSDFAFYVGSELSFAPRTQTDPPSPLAPGTYTVTLNAFSGAFGGGNLDITDNITGVGMQGQIFSIQPVNPITITLNP
ncbi:carboxypeptidase regulatory-like domain-containing protein [Meiothermus cerbereus]|uniref:carboxypeptidase regulatory-like domain-containing protein n=1 Tax=Meiothermus cerbereus TaxID=65552 RepID=UPI002FD9C0AE